MNPAEKQYISSTPLSHRKKFGQFFTPDKIVFLLQKWVIAGLPKTVLDPAVGTGKLLSGLPKGTLLTGYEVDEELLQQADQALSNRYSLQLFQQDFLTASWETEFDAIICNPPYIKFKSYPNKPVYFDLFKKKMKLTLSGYTNLYVLFLLKGLHQLAPNGRAAFIVPTEFLNNSYGQPVRSLLADKGILAAAAVTDFTLSWFDDAATTSTLLFIDNNHAGRDTAFFHLENEQQLTALGGWMDGEAFPVQKKVVSDAELAANQKWQSFYQTEQDFSGYALKPLEAFAKVNRGIATGANDYFCFTKQKKQEWKLEDTDFLRCLSRARQVNGPFFNEKAWEKIYKEDDAALLLDIKDSKIDNGAVSSYLTHGINNGIDRKYLTKRRRPWYKQEIRLPAPILVKVFFREHPVFIRNESDAVNLTAFHCVYPLPDYEKDTDVLMAYLLTGFSRKVLSSRHKQYGKGLKKFEPGDLKSAPVADLDRLTTAEKEQILEEYQQVRNNYLEKGRFDSSGLDQLFEQILSL